jgi:hypothetical protein
MAGAAILLAFLVRKLVSRIPVLCPYCESRLIPLAQMPCETREAIPAYFHKDENRTPAAGNIEVCLQCKRVHDDFSLGLNRVLLRSKLPSDNVMINMTICKSCHHRMPTLCDAVTTCPECGTVYSWQPHESSGYLFLDPKQSISVLPCEDGNILI